MAKFDYVTALNTADELLDDFGKTLVLTKKTNGAFDTSTGLQTVTDTTRKAVGVVLDWTIQERATLGIKEDSKKVLLSPKKLKSDPDITETMKIDGLQYSIRRVMKTAPKDIVVLYTLEVGV